MFTLIISPPQPLHPITYPYDTTGGYAYYFPIIMHPRHDAFLYTTHTTNHLKSSWKASNVVD